MLNVPDEDKGYLLAAIGRGEAVLVLGAGASFTSQNSRGENVLQSADLARLLAERAGQPFSDESLTDVLGAIEPAFLSRDQVIKVLDEEYRRVEPSDELIAIFDYTWKRLYTWSIDDSIENIKSSSGVQRRHHFNGLVDKVALYKEVKFLHIVHLHGQITKPEHGFILTEKEYNSRMTSDRHDWYKRAVQDYVAYTPIFIGSKLKEPILSLELDRARADGQTTLGRAYLISPDKFTPIQAANLRARNIIHLNGTLSDFIQWLKSDFAKRSTPADTVRRTSAFANEIIEKFGLDASDADTLRTIYPISYATYNTQAQNAPADSVTRAASDFLRGAPPSWLLAATNVPVWLKDTDRLLSKLSEAVARRDRLFLVTGQLGSGKTTALLQSILKYSKDNVGVKIYELSGEVRSLRATLQLLAHIHDGEHIILYINDISLYGDSFSEDVLSLKAGKITIVSSARSGEWEDHLRRRMGDFAVTVEYQRFMEEDYQGLIDRLIKFVPAPGFMKLGPDKRLEKLAKSQSQLLIALRETTESERFTRLITKEFEDLPSDDCRTLLMLTGIATLARVGVSEGMAREAFARLQTERKFDDARPALAGIVVPYRDGRLAARHELYVRHLIENVAGLHDIIQIVIELLRTYTKYKIPVTKNVGRYDAQLFKFLLGHNFLFQLAERRGLGAAALRVYEEFEIDFQLDGHFWLQYGQCLVELGSYDRALDALRKSIRAYPENNYAWHSLADVQLRVAKARAAYDSEAVDLIGSAVKTLMEQDASPDLQTDQYAIVTLAHGHIGALVHHSQTEQAKRFARQYLDRIQDLERKFPDSALRHAREKLFAYVATGEWRDTTPGRRPRR